MAALKKQFKDLTGFLFDFVYKDKKKSKSELPEHFHDLYEIFYVHSGKGSFFIANNFYKVDQGDLFIIPRDMIHHTLPSKEDPPTISAFYFDSGLIQEIKNADHFKYMDLFKHSKEKKDFKLSLKPHHQNLMEFQLSKIQDEITLKPYGYQSAIIQWLHHILLSLSRLKLSQDPIPNEIMQSAPHWMKETLQYIDQDLKNAPSLSELAKQAYVSPEHFSRVFKKLTGMTLTEYLNSKKLILAKGILENTEENISDIAETIGFKNHTHFYRVFKHHIGVTPSVYRKQHRPR